jgi:serine O-acetyltransferase
MPRIKQAVRQVKKLFVTPLLILFTLTTEKQAILSDIRRWKILEINEYTSLSDLDNLLILLGEYREFRNLYYYRIYQGNILAIILMLVLKKFYPEHPMLVIRKSCTIGCGMFIQHGFGSVINATIGDNCWINQQVTIGFNDESGCRPMIGNNVRIAAGAKVLGGITVHDNVVIGANAVVVKDVPPNCVVVGVPAYIVRRNGVRVNEKL